MLNGGPLADAFIVPARLSRSKDWNKEPSSANVFLRIWQHRGGATHFDAASRNSSRVMLETQWQSSLESCAGEALRVENKLFRMDVPAVGSDWLRVSSFF